MSHKKFTVRLLLAVIVGLSIIPAPSLAADLATNDLPVATVARPAAPASGEAAIDTSLQLAASDALHDRIRAELRQFTDWLAAHQVDGVVGEVGWPNDARGDGERWNALGEAWYRDADAASLWVTYWDSGESRNTYPLAVYKPTLRMRSPLSIADHQARVIESHVSTAGYQRGVYLSSAVVGAPYRDEATSSFSNANPGRYGVDYTYDSGPSFQFLAQRGMTVVTIGFRWERLQPRLGETFDEFEFGRLKAAVAQAEQAGLQVILQPFNKAAYYQFDGTQGVKLLMGPTATTRAYFNDLWLRLSDAFRDNPTVVAYGLMNEPAASIRPETWERTSQEAVTTIRANGDGKLILVPGARWSVLREWTRTHPVAWISDPFDNIRYEAHHYFDSDATGVYANGYADDLQAAWAAGYGTLAAAPGASSSESNEATQAE